MGTDDTPVIGITFDPDPDPRSEIEYCRALEHAGARVVPVRSYDPALLGLLDGLMLSGGRDIDPRHYGEPLRRDSVMVNEERDACELLILRDALRGDLPVLAICRGIQVLNVVCGGTLYQDLRDDLGRELLPEHGHYRDFPDQEMRRKLRHGLELLAPESRLGAILAKTGLEVNSRHHQAIKDLAPGFQVVARSPDGVIEAIESDRHRWVIGVQWHPEATGIVDRFRLLFGAFVAAGAGKRREEGTPGCLERLGPPAGFGPPRAPGPRGGT